MGHFDDFDLDIIQVDSTAENETKGVTSGFWCSYITGKFVDSLFESCATCAANPLSCDCSASDMTACRGNGLAHC